jgi:hypothetical protein
MSEYCNSHLDHGGGRRVRRRRNSGVGFLQEIGADGITLRRFHESDDGREDCKLSRRPEAGRKTQATSMDSASIPNSWTGIGQNPLGGSGCWHGNGDGSRSRYHFVGHSVRQSTVYRSGGCLNRPDSRRDNERVRAHNVVSEYEHECAYRSALAALAYANAAATAFATALTSAGSHRGQPIAFGLDNTDDDVNNSATVAQQ